MLVPGYEISAIYQTQKPFKFPSVRNLSSFNVDFVVDWNIF